MAIGIYNGQGANGTPIRFLSATVNSSGNWSLTVDLLGGTHSLTATQTQVAGVTSDPSAVWLVTVTASH